MENETHQLTDEILKLTSEIRAIQPGLYSHLDETPMFSSSKPKLTTKDLEDYRNTLKRQLKELTDKSRKEIERLKKMSDEELAKIKGEIDEILNS